MTTTTTTIPVRITRDGSRQFRASVMFGPSGAQREVSGSVSKTRKGALRSMEEALRASGYTRDFPAWSPVEVSPAAKSESTPAPATEPEAHVAPAPERASIEQAADAAEQAIEQAMADAPAVGAPGTRMRPGRINPLTALDLWVDEYLAVTSKFLDVQFPGETPDERVRNFRDSITLVMNEHGFASAYDRDPGGTTWITRVTALRPEVFDVTRKAPTRRGLKTFDKVRTFAGNATRVAEHGPAYRPGEKPEPKPAPPVELSPASIEVLGEVRAVQEGLAKQSGAPAPKSESKAAPVAQSEGHVAEGTHEGVRYLKLESGRWVNEQGERPSREVRRALNQGLMKAQSPRTEKAKYAPQNSHDSKSHQAAFRWAIALKRAARAEGQSETSQSLAYKVGIVAGLRAQGATPFPEYEASVREAGATEEYLGQMAEMFLEAATAPATAAND